MLSASLCLAPRQALSLPTALIRQQIGGSKTVTTCQEHRAGEGQGRGLPQPTCRPPARGGAHFGAVAEGMLGALWAGQQVACLCPEVQAVGERERLRFLQQDLFFPFGVGLRPCLGLICRADVVDERKLQAAEVGTRDPPLGKKLRSEDKSREEAFGHPGVAVASLRSLRGGPRGGQEGLCVHTHAYTVCARGD